LLVFGLQPNIQQAIRKITWGFSPIVGTSQLSGEFPAVTKIVFCRTLNSCCTVLAKLYGLSNGKVLLTP